MSKRTTEQIPMRYSKRGGARLGAGRPRKRDAIHHDERAVFTRRMPVHVDLTFLDHVWNLRTRRCFLVIAAALVAVRAEEGFRVVGFSLQSNHLHLLVEADSSEALSRAMHGLGVRIARGLNKLMGRSGPVFRERYFARVLATPTEVKRAQEYIARNTAKHAAEYGKRLPADFRDPYTAGYFGNRLLLPSGAEGLVQEPTQYLLTQGWKLVASDTAPRRVIERGDVARSRSRRVRIPEEVLPSNEDGSRSPRRPEAEVRPGQLALSFAA
jgi:putative transposase